MDRRPEAPERRLTVDDLANTPDDGLRYELVDGRLDVPPAPSPDTVWSTAGSPRTWEIGLPTNPSSSSSPDPVGQSQGEELFETDFPFPVELVPRRLLASGPWREHIGGTPATE